MRLLPVLCLPGFLWACGADGEPAPRAGGAVGATSGSPGASPTASSSSSPAQIPGDTPPVGKSTEGIATYYAATGSGNCGFDASPNDLMVAAMNAEEYAGSSACGTCIDVVGPSGSVRVRIVDQCPECKRGHLDLSKEAFAKIAAVSAGRVPISWTPVRCDIKTPVRYRIKEGSSQWWTAIQVRDHALPIAKLEILKGGAATDVPRESYNYFVLPSGVGPAAYRVRMTSSTGAVLEDDMPVVAENAVVTGHAQFP